MALDLCIQVNQSGSDLNSLFWIKHYLLIHFITIVYPQGVRSGFYYSRPRDAVLAYVILHFYINIDGIYFIISCIWSCNVVT